jgi:hypothetical protein
MQTLNLLMLQVLPKCKLWFLDGKDSRGKIVSNSNIGYGSYNVNMQMAQPKNFIKLG